MRIARALALAGIDSRRKCEEYIRRGEVRVNGEQIHDLGRQVDPDNDHIELRGRTIQFEKHVYFLLHKPVGYVTTAGDPNAKKTVFDLLPTRLVPRTHKPMPSRTRVFPVGRLDKDSSGLLLMTNDGELANHLTHPRYQVGKWYEVRIDRALEPADLSRLLRGVDLDDGPAKAEKVRRLSRRSLMILIKEGRNREIRRMLESLNYEVVQLSRVAFGPLTLGKLQPGHGRFLSMEEVRDLKKNLEKPFRPKGV